MKNAVEILGRGFSISYYVHDETCDTYAINMMCEVYRRKYGELPTKTFWMDSFAITEKVTPGWAEFLKEGKIEIISSDTFVEYPWIKGYPLRELMAVLGSYFPHCRWNWINNTVVYALLHAALIDRYEEIHLHGIDFSADNILRDEEKACTCYWIGLLQGFGIEVKINKFSDLCDYNTHERDRRNGWGYPFYGYVKSPDGIDKVFNNAKLGD
jgi:hypothetical protein